MVISSELVLMHYLLVPILFAFVLMLYVLVLMLDMFLLISNLREVRLVEVLTPAENVPMLTLLFEI